MSAIKGTPKKRKLSKTTKRSTWKQKALEEENEQLTDLLFGSTGIAGEENENPFAEESNNSNYDYPSFKFEEEGENNEEDETKATDKHKKKQKTSKEQQVWHDSDDEELEVSLLEENRRIKLRKTKEENVVSGKVYIERLRQQFQSTQVQNADWAAVKEEEEVNDDDDDDEILRSAKSLKKTKDSKLAPTIIRITQLRDVNNIEKNQCTSRVVKFHPSAPILLTCGFDKTIRLFNVTGKENPLLKSVYIKDLPIYSASFLNDGEEIICTGRKPYFYRYDLIAGEVTKIDYARGRTSEKLDRFIASNDSKYIAVVGIHGGINLLSGKSKQWIGDFKINDRVGGMAFSPDSKYFYCSTVSGEIYKWDLGTRKCLHRFQDEGSFASTSLAISPTDTMLAAGSKSGVVNLYDMDDVLGSSNPTPKREFLNITTDINCLKFNHDSQLLAFSSFDKKNQFRLAHVASQTVFENFPRCTEKMGYVSDFDFSPNSGYLAVGNDHGRVLLYRLNHFKH